MSTTTVFKAPLGGWYKISSKILISEPVPGEFVDVPNPEYAWWKFWESPTIRVQRFKVREEFSGQEIKYLNTGQEIDVTNHLIPPYRIS